MIHLSSPEVRFAALLCPLAGGFFQSPADPVQLIDMPGEGTRVRPRGQPNRPGESAQRKGVRGQGITARSQMGRV
jgi:hypothetical protein